MEVWASPVRDEAGNVESAVVAFQDITRRKQAEAELDRYRQNLEALVGERTAELNTANEQLRLHLEWLSAVNLVNQVMASSADFTQIYQKIIEIINHLFVTQGSFISEWEAGSRQLKILAHSCRCDLHPDLAGSITVLPESDLFDSVLEGGKLASISRDQRGLLNGPMGQHMRDMQIQGLALVPLQLREQRLGCNVDNVSIAGGEPLMHPDIMDVVTFIKQQGIKPIMLTNGLKLDHETVVELKKAGLAGFTIHIDSNQGRPQWREKTEVETNELRQHFADMIYDVGDLYVVFNSTVYPATMHYIPEMVKWALKNIDRVHGLVFICFRTAPLDEEITYQAGEKIVDARHLGYASEVTPDLDITSSEVYDLIRAHLPEYDTAGYLGGTWKIDTIKWLAAKLHGLRARRRAADARSRR